MQLAKVPGIQVETTTIESTFLEREVIVDVYLPLNVADSSQISLLLINDGQDLPKLKLM